MRSNVVLLASLVALFVVPTKAATAERRDRNAREFTGGTGWGSTREEIQEHRNQRKRQLKSMIHAMRKKLADHSAGEITLDPKEKADTERRVDLYSRKLDMLKQDLEEKDIERIIERSQSQNKRREATKEEMVSSALRNEL